MNKHKTENTCFAVSSVKQTARFIALFTALTLALAGCGGGAESESRPPEKQNDLPPPSGNYVSDDARAFTQEVWSNLRIYDVCGRCHSSSAESAQRPYFADIQDNNFAYDQVISNNLVNLSNPAASRLVERVRDGHHCWLGDPPDTGLCAETMTRFIENWLNGSERGETEVSSTLRDQIRPVNFPDTGVQYFMPENYDVSFTWFNNFHNLVTGSNMSQPADCVRCHSSQARNAVSPYFADPDPATAYAAARTIINLNTVLDQDNNLLPLEADASRPVQRVRGRHNCWSDDCTTDATAIRSTIQDMLVGVRNSSTSTERFPIEIRSDKMDLTNGFPVSSGNRYDVHQIALYEFKDGVDTDNQSRTIADTSGVEPILNLRLTGTHSVDDSGDFTWLSNWGIRFHGGYAQSDTSASRKLHDLLRLSGEFSIEAWLVPSNVVDQNRSIFEYGTTLRVNNNGEAVIDRNVGLSQNMYNYQYYLRSSTLEPENQPQSPPLTTADADEDLQSSLQHVVITYNRNEGRRIYVNGEFTGDVDDVSAGDLFNWASEYHVLSIGGAPSGPAARLWNGTFRMLSFHSAALTPDQVRQNYAAEVGQKFLLPFKVDHLLDNGTAENYIVFEVNQFDDHGYLFRNPRYINLDSNNASYVPETPINLNGLHVGMNGDRVAAGQAYNHVATGISGDNGYTPQNGQLLSNIDTVIQVQYTGNDVFFLAFDEIGSFNFANSGTGMILDVADQTVVPQLPVIALANRSPDYGLRIFDEINAAMAQMTHISDWQTSSRLTPTGEDVGINAVYNNYRRQFPSVESIDSFSSAHQMAIAQLAMSYCNELVQRESAAQPPAVPYFSGFNFTANTITDVNGKFDDSSTMLEDRIIDPLIQNMLNATSTTSDTADTNLATQPDVTLVRNELIWLIRGKTAGAADDRDGLLSGSACSTATTCTNRVKQLVTATCAATLGSAAMLIQ